MHGLPPDTRIGRARLRVGDLERSLTFYRDVLGLQVSREAGNGVTLASGEQRETNGSTAGPRELLVLEERRGIARRPLRPVTTGLYHVALLVPSRRALGRTLLGLRQAGYPLRGMSDHAVSESLYLDDPDGNGLEIYADRPRQLWPVRHGVVQMTVDPMDVEGVMAAARERPEPWTGLPTETVVGHVHFTVSRLDPAVAFYRDVIGFDEMMRILERLTDRFEVCYEASCGYGHFHDLLRPVAARVLVAHPGQLRLIYRSKNKNDRNDAERLAKLLYLGEVPTVHRVRLAGT